MINDSNCQYMVWLTAKTGIRRKRLTELLNRFGSAEAIYEATYDEYLNIPFLSDANIKALCDKSLDGIASYMHQLELNSVKLICLGDEEYPEMLANIEDPPVMLYCRGHFLDLNNYLCVSIVGSRNPTEYGKKITRDAASALAESGIITVSGLALGVDSIVHSASLEHKMPTVAVIGCGVNIIYPKSNYALAAEICKIGMIISEYPLSAAPERFHFPERNRIIAGISHATVITEAASKSGSLITADYAFRHGRDVFSFPGSVYSPLSAGTNELIKQGACPITGASEITMQYKDLYKDNLAMGKRLKKTEKKSNTSENNNHERIKKQQSEYLNSKESTTKNNGTVHNDTNRAAEKNLSVDEIILSAINDEPLTVDMICRNTSLSLADVNMKILMLELSGKVKRTNGNYFLAVK